MIPPSLLSGDNAAFLDQQYRAWLREPRSVDEEWQVLFESWDKPSINGHLPGDAPSFLRRTIFNPASAAGAGSGAEVASLRQARVAQLVNAYRVRGHLLADIDPLGRRDRVRHPELTLDHYGLNTSDLDERVATSPLFGIDPVAPLREVVDRCEAAYCDAIGAEFMNIDDQAQKLWVTERLERLPDREVLDREGELDVLRKMADAENFETLLHTRFPGTKRFSLEGAETLIPLLDLLVERSAALGVREIVFGMAHRGRLNCLVNVLGKPVQQVVREFQDQRSDTFQGSGDVKYHVAFSADRRTAWGDIHLSLTPNPSHLEAVDPIVQGRVRAKQDRHGDAGGKRCVPVLIHGDAAFAGQGVVAETLNMSELPGYATGGTIHVVINNQIGFTTTPAEGRSMPYATGVARMLGVPIFHVNGENPRAVAAVTQIATEWRQAFGRDVVIDMYCYRKYGHNEGDEPAFTQPHMYAIIRSLQTPREVFQRMLVSKGELTEDEAEEVVRESRAGFEAALDVPEVNVDEGLDDVGRRVDPDLDLYGKKGAAGVTATRGRIEVESPLKGLWSRFTTGSIHDEADTRLDLDGLRKLLRKAFTAPQGFEAHSKIRRLLRQRREMVAGERAVDWAVGELAAYATLCRDGYRVRLSGQDVGRGTFSHRHAVLTDTGTGRQWIPLAELAPDQAPFEVINSPLSEMGVLGFEVGYAMDYPDALVLWEAQFGDFANGAQVIIDQFIAAAEQKWHRFNGITLLLPHGYEGQGPEHSSARLERYLALCADDNLQVATCTTPANFYHLLRRQMIRAVRKPLIVMSPKSLLRHPECVSSIEELATGAFQRVIPDPEIADLAGVRRVVLCAGKVYYDLIKARRASPTTEVAIHRVELLHPFPADDLRALIAASPGAEVVWCQEESRNMGPWPRVLHFVHEQLERVPRYIGRPASASPATGYHDVFRREQEALVNEALSL